MFILKMRHSSTLICSLSLVSSSTMTHMTFRAEPRGGYTHLVTAWWISLIQTCLSSLEAACSSYISGGEESLIRNMPRSWLAMSRMMSPWRESTAGLSCSQDSQGERERERERDGREMNRGTRSRKGGARESKKTEVSKAVSFYGYIEGILLTLLSKATYNYSFTRKQNGLSQSRRATASSSGAGRVRRLAQGHCDTQGIELATFWLTVNPSPLPPQLLSPQILQLSLISDSLIRDG